MTATAPEKKDVVPSSYREKYKSTGGTNGDFIAVELQRIAKDGLDSLNSVKAENGIEAARWATFNPGMQRMNLANVLRGSYLKGETVKLLGKEYNVRHQLEDFNGTVTDDDKVLSRAASFLNLIDSDRTVGALRKLLFSTPRRTAAEVAADKAVKDAEKAKAKQDKADAAAKVKADKDAAAAKAKADKADAAAKAKADKAASKPKTAKAA